MSDPVDCVAGLRIKRADPVDAWHWKGFPEFAKGAHSAFRSGIKRGARPSDEAVQRCAEEVWDAHRTPWAKPLIHPELRMATGTILIEVPQTIERLRDRQTSANAKRLAETYQALFDAAQAVTDAGGGFSPNRAKNLGRKHRDQRAVFYTVSRTLEAAGKKRVGTGSVSPAVTIAVELLRLLGINSNSDRLSQLLKRRVLQAPVKRGTNEKPSCPMRP